MKIACGFAAGLLVSAMCWADLRAQVAAPPVQETGKGEASVPPVAEAPETKTPGSDVRIVRLSQVKGQVQLDRKTDRGFEAAFANLPVTQGAKLKTAEGVAEVEFEDNSTLRMTPNTVIEFPQLKLGPTGATTSTIHVLQGTVYVSMAKTKGNEFLLAFGEDRVALPPSSHIELHVGAPSTRLQVFDGTAEVQGATGVVTKAGKKKALVFDAEGKTPPTLVSNLEEGPFDEWDRNLADYHKRYANAAAFGSTGARYGVSDMNYYGSFVNLGSCGSVWRPYFVSAAWDPFSNGIWSWYPNAGYTWVSPYPWGWTPFHSGSWQQCGGSGWGWRPGGQWNGLTNAPQPTKLGPTHLRPPLPPSPGRPTSIAVSTRPLPTSRLASGDKFEFRNDSAGMGVPRQSFGKLGKVSAGVAQHGIVSTPVYLTPGESSAQTNPRGRGEERAQRGGEHAGAPGAPSARGGAVGSGAGGDGGQGRTVHGSTGSPNGGQQGTWTHGGGGQGNGGGGMHGAPQSAPGGGMSGGSHPMSSGSAPSAPASAPSPGAGSNRR